MRALQPYAERTTWSCASLVHEPGHAVFTLRTWNLPPRCNDHGGLSDSGCVTAVCHEGRPGTLYVDVDGDFWLVADLLFCPEVDTVLVVRVTGGGRWKRGPRANLDTLRWDARLKAQGKPSPFQDVAPLHDLRDCVRGLFGACLDVEPYTHAAHARLRRRHARAMAASLAALAPALPHASVAALVGKHMRPGWFLAEKKACASFKVE